MRSLPLVALLLVAPIGTVRAQSPADTVRAVRIGMASDLRNLVTAQEAHFAERGRYAPDIATLTGYRTSRGNRAELVRAEANRWGAVIRSTGFEGSCVIHVGLGADDFPRTAIEQKAFPEGEPACDGDGEVEAKRWGSASAFAAQRMLTTVAKLQERYFGRTGRYATDLTQLEGLRPDPQVMIAMEVTPAESRVPGFLLVATHARYAGVSCVLRSGWGPWAARALSAAEKKRPAAELQVVCDEFGR